MAILLEFVNITIECVGITVEAQAQKVYQKMGIITRRSGEKDPSAGSRKSLGMDPKI